MPAIPGHINPGSNGKVHSNGHIHRFKDSLSLDPLGEKIEPATHTALPKGRLLAKYGQRLEEALRNCIEGTDHIEIGSATSESVGDVECCTAQDAEKEIAQIKYLCRDWIPYRMLTGVIAEPGVGKSALVLWIARTVMTGGQWFNGTKGPSESGKVLWLGTENDLAITLHRMKSWGIPMDCLVLPFKDPLQPVNLMWDGHLEHVEKLINMHRTSLVVVDSLRGGHDSDENDSRVARLVLQKLAAIAERTKVALVIVHHTKKLAEGEAIKANSSRGNNAILAMFRSMLGVDKPDPGSPWNRVRLLKENLGIQPNPIGFRVTDKGLEFGPPPEKPEKETKDTKKGGAVEWLKSYMEPGKEYAAAEVLKLAERFGFKKGVMKQARDELGVEATNKSAGWVWVLPPGPEGP